jgi:hypothetical protein
MTIEITLIEEGVKVEAQRARCVCANEVGCIAAANLTPRLRHTIHSVVVILIGPCWEQRARERMVSGKPVDVPAISGGVWNLIT